MKKKTPLSHRPGSKEKKELNDFIKEGGAPETETEPGAEIVQPSRDYPWEDPSLRADVQKIFNLRIPEPYLVKLRYIADHTPLSMQSFCREILLAAIDEKIEELKEDEQ
ncbi:hypothetical protein ACFL2Q_19125 [Thermodesulfobacteriota bacterium]